MFSQNTFYNIFYMYGFKHFDVWPVAYLEIWNEECHLQGGYVPASDPPSSFWLIPTLIKPITHRRRRLDATVELSRVGGVLGISQWRLQSASWLA